MSKSFADDLGVSLPLSVLSALADNVLKWVRLFSLWIVRYPS
jgi:hypothetical protein